MKLNNTLNPYKVTLFTLLVSACSCLVASGQTVPRDIVTTSFGPTLLEAGNTITLSPGFTVTAGSTFTAKIRPEKFITEQAQNLNYIKSEEMLVPLNSTTAVGNAFVAQKKINYQYFDGLGRPIQAVAVKESPAYGDIVMHMEYDNLGRQAKEFLPFVAVPGDGVLKTGAATAQASFYDVNKGLYNNNIKTDAAPYKLSVFEASPLNRVTQSGAGAAWQPDPNNFNGANNKAVKMAYQTNTHGTAAGQEQIINWTIASNLPYNAYNSAFYSSNALTVSITYDEENRQVRQYTDKKGQMILKKVQYVTGTAATNNDNDWAMTYYVYDAFNNLRFVLPPEFCTRIASYSISNSLTQQALLNTWCFQYSYDARNRMITKQVPGADVVEMVYDKYDRLVLTRDGNQRAASQWMFTKYDQLNRPIMTGIYSNSTSRSNLQISVNSFTANFANRFERPAAGSVGYTTNATFPTTVGINELLTISYYDDYSYKTNLSLGTAYDFVSVAGFTGTPLNRLKGKPTGTKIKVLGTTPAMWLTSAIYYDTYYRTLQTVADDHKGNKNRITNEYFGITSWVTKSKQEHGSLFTRLTETDYDHRGRVLKTYSTLDSSPRTMLTSNTYNEVGQLIEKNIHSTDNGGSFLQSTDYRYNIRGWMTSINKSDLSNDGIYNNDTNDLYGLQLLYNEAAESVNGTNTVPQFNGNIAAMKWSTKNLIDAPKEKIYGFDYDALNRMTGSRYASKSGSTWTAEGGNFDEALTYDKVGNIKTLSRYGLYGGTKQQIDQLAYEYKGGGFNSNQLITVTDNSANYQWGKQDAGFVENTHTAGLTEMDYDNNGNLNKDLNKNITGITYNHLNLPTLITISGNKTIQYTYDAAGTKLKYVATDNGTTIKVSDYIYGIQYEASQIAFVSTGEGRAMKKPTGWEYEYHLKDHLGNTRVAFGNLQDVDSYTATMETEAATTEEATFKNVAATRNTVYNHTVANSTTPSPTKNSKLNGQMGLAKSFAVTAGDSIKLEVYARYNTGGSSTDFIPSLLSLVMSTFNVTAGENPTANAGFNRYPSLVDGLTNSNAGQPNAYINYILFDQNYNDPNIANTTAPQVGFKMISSTAANGWEKLEMKFKANKTGFGYFYLSNESNYDVYFDDFKITQIKTTSGLKVVQAQDYYPFGLTFNNYQRENNPANDFKYNGKEMQDEFALNWLDYGARMYMSDIGRWGVVDPASSAYHVMTPYQYVRNNPVILYDLNGMFDQELVNKWERQDLEENGFNYSAQKGVDSDGQNGTQKNGETESPLEPFFGPKDRIAAARQFIGKGYSYSMGKDNQGRALRNKFTPAAMTKQDCIELVVRVMYADGILESMDVGDYDYYLASKSSIGVVLNDKTQFLNSQSPVEGDIAFWEGHIGVVSAVNSDGTFKLIHASRPHEDSRLDIVENPNFAKASVYHKGTFYGFYRPINETGDGKNIDITKDR